MVILRGIYTLKIIYLILQVRNGCTIIYYVNDVVLAVSGTHGKTTTTAILSWILEKNNLHPGFLIGGIARNFGTSAQACKAHIL